MRRGLWWPLISYVSVRQLNITYFKCKYKVLRHIKCRRILHTYCKSSRDLLIRTWSSTLLGTYRYMVNILNLLWSMGCDYDEVCCVGSKRVYLTLISGLNACLTFNGILNELTVFFITGGNLH